LHICGKSTTSGFQFGVAGLIRVMKKPRKMGRTERGLRGGEVSSRLVGHGAAAGRLGNARGAARKHCFAGGTLQWQKKARGQVIGMGPGALAAA